MSTNEGELTATPRDVLCQEIETRIDKTRVVMDERGYDTLIVFGTNKVCGSLRYLTDYLPDRTGWVSLGPRENYIFEGAALVVPLVGEPVLFTEPGLWITKEICIKNVSVGGLSPDLAGDQTPTVGMRGGLTANNVAEIVKKSKASGKIGVESWDRFPAPLYIELKELLPRIKFERSTVVEELRMIKSPLEIELMRKAAAIGDLGHQAVIECLKNGIGKTEVDVIRAGEQAMRNANPIYDDYSNTSPSLICSGVSIAGGLLHHPSHTKRIEKADAVLWDLCMRYEGYSADVNRVRVMGKATDAQKRAHETSLRMYQAVLEAMRPGVKASDLVELASKTARDNGFELWERFIGHGVGLETHERPDMGVEETRLAAGMFIALEPRVAIEGKWLLGNEDCVMVTENGGESFSKFPKTPLELEV
jgi:Xaa-Pro aminopeptidase